MQRKSFAPGDVICEKGDPGDALYVIMKGQVKIVLPSPDGNEALLATMDLFRWVSRETAERLGFSYPAMVEERAAEWVQNRLSEGPR